MPIPFLFITHPKHHCFSQWDNSVTSPVEQLSCWTGHWQERASLKLCQFPLGQAVWNVAFLMEEYLQAPWGWLQTHPPWTSGPQRCDNSFWSPGGWHLSTSEGYLGPQLPQTATAHLQDIGMTDVGHLEIRRIRIFNLLIYFTSKTKTKNNKHHRVKNHRYHCWTLESWQWKGAPRAWRMSL